jgi:hypothetical protein
VIIGIGCSFVRGSLGKHMAGPFSHESRLKDRQRDRETERHRDRDRETETEAERERPVS